MFEEYRSPSHQRIRLYLSLWGTLFLTSVLSGRRQDLSTMETLRKSHFARVMFADIGALSTLGALYAVLTGKSRVRFVAGVASLFVGSFALLPYLAYEDWRSLNRSSSEDAEV